MQFAEWAPAYDAIRRDMGYDRAADERARDALATLVSSFDTDHLPAFDGATVAVCGAAASLEADLDRACTADVVVAASAAADVLRDADVPVDAMVTDLDKNPETARTLTYEDTPVAVHAHGDNLSAIREHVPRFSPEYVLGTTQVEPRGPVVNYGGFTDGDRAAFLADTFGAAALVFPGWNLDDSTVDDEKQAKLRWAERLLYWLERRRDDRFDLLDGRRESLSMDWLTRG